MTSDIGRRNLIGKGLPAAGAVALLGTALAPGRASAEEAGTGLRLHPLVGTWTTVTTIEGSTRPPEEGMFAYNADGILSGTDASRVTGFGTWKATGPASFAVEYRHYVIQNDAIGGTVVVTMTGTVTSATSFTESGEAKLVAPDGTVILTHKAKSVGTRFGFAPPRIGRA